MLRVKCSRDKKCKARTEWVGGEKSLLCAPGSELRLLIGGRENRRAKIINGMEKKKTQKNIICKASTTFTVRYVYLYFCMYILHQVKFSMSLSVEVSV